MIDINSGSFSIHRTDQVEIFNDFDHQREAWEKLSTDFLENNRKAGIIHVPTGGGKTIIAAKWLLEQIITNDDFVIWFAERENLLIQAANEFQTLYNSNLITNNNSNTKYHTFFISGNSPYSWKNVTNFQSPSIIFSTLASSTGRVKTIYEFISSVRKRIYIVYDECHHAQAPKRYRLLSTLKELSNVQLIGLTATPKCYDPASTILLWKLFDGDKLDNKNNTRLDSIYSVSVKDLKAAKILAEPHFDTYDTHIDEKYIRKECNLKNAPICNKANKYRPEVIKFLANHPDRLKVIYDEYTSKPKYGKTIIFTSNIEETNNLYSLFIKNGHTDVVRAHSDKETLLETTAHDALERFRTDDSCKVLINVEMATEGYNVPKTETIFISRPIRSDGLLIQMIGRALRGKNAGGKDSCNLISFLDTWNTENNKPIKLEELYERMQIEIVVTPDEDPFEELAPHFHQYIHSLHLHQNMNKFYHIPHAYVQIDNDLKDDDSEEDNINQYILFPKHQLGGIKAFINNDKYDLPYEEIISIYFNDCPDPLPSKKYILELVNALKSNERFKNNYFREINEKFIERLDPEKYVYGTNYRKKKKHLINLYYDGSCFFNKTATNNCEFKKEKEYSRIIKSYEDESERLIEAIDSKTRFKFQNLLLSDRYDDFCTYLNELFGSFIHDNPSLKISNKDIAIEIFKEKYCTVNRIVFNRAYKYQKLIVFNEILNSKYIPTIIFEYLIYHSLMHLRHPYDPLGLDFVFPSSRFFRPSQKSIDELEKEYCEIYIEIVSKFHSKFDKSINTNEDQFLKFCTGYLMVYNKILNHNPKKTYFY